MNYFTDKNAELLQEEADARQVPIESLLAEMEIPQSTLDEKISYEQYLFIKSVANSAIKYGLFGLINEDYEKEINLIEDTLDVTSTCSPEQDCCPSHILDQTMEED